MSISAWPSIDPSLPCSTSRRASSTSRRVRKRRKSSARKTIISGPPTYSPSVNCQPSTSAITMPSSTTRFVDASSNAIAEVKSAPFRNSVRASATDAYEQEDEAIPERGRLGERAGSSRREAGRSIRLLRNERLHERGEQETEDERPEDLPGHADREAERLPELVQDVDREDHPREAWSSGVSWLRCGRGARARPSSSWYALSALTAQMSCPTPASRLSTARSAVSIEWSELL
jgi:hypothetical protein